MFVVNLKGRPFMGGLSENKPLLYSLAATFALTFMSASETIPRVSFAEQGPRFSRMSCMNCYIASLCYGSAIVLTLLDRV